MCRLRLQAHANRKRLRTATEDSDCVPGFRVKVDKEEVTNEWQEEVFGVMEGIWLLTLMLKSVLGLEVKGPESAPNNVSCMLILKLKLKT